jgi:hypothetical protein
LYVSELLTEGSACSTNAPLQKGDQLVGVDASLVLGSDLDATLDKIRDSETATTKLTMFRGPTAFLYGPSACPRPDNRMSRQNAPTLSPLPQARMHMLVSLFTPDCICVCVLSSSQLPHLPSGTRRRCCESEVRMDWRFVISVRSGACGRSLCRRPSILAR